MKVSELLPGVPAEAGAKDISLVTQDSRAAGPGALFFAIEGTSRDGHDFVADVLVKGAAAVVVRRGHPRSAEHHDPRIIAVDDPRQAMGEAAARFFGEPSRELLVCAVTGTNGKTTSTYLLEALLSAWGKKPAVIGTVENRFADYRVPSTHTTPDALGLQKLFRDFRARGADAVCMEVTSHAIEQKRVAGTRFAAALFTNLTQDHLDYHGTMESYFQAKARLFTDYRPPVCAIHHDDPYGARLAEICRSQRLETVTYGRESCNVNIGALTINSEGISGEISVDWKGGQARIPIRSRLLGGFNAQNLAGAVAVGVGLGMGPKLIGEALSAARSVPGRMETVPNNHGVTVVVDYAHTPDALEKALKTLREIAPKRLICVFGCGGDRDSAKRPIMGEIAERLSDMIFVTSDNPRTENPEAIIDQIFAGLKAPSDARRESDRRLAIAQAIKLLKPGDVLLIAGKGHEDYQIIGTRKLPFDDRKVALENL